MDSGPEYLATDSQQRVLTALRCGQPDRVPVLVHINPYVEDWYTYVPSYADALSAANGFGDVVFNWDLPAPFMFTAGERWIEQRDLGGGRIEQIIHTPDGPLTEVAHRGWRERDVIKRWIQTADDADRALSMPYVPIRPDLSDFLNTASRLAGRAVSQVTFCEPIALADWIDEGTLATWRKSERGLLRQLLDTAFERLADGLRTCLDAGAGPLYVSRRGRLSGLEHLPLTDIEELIVGYARRLVELIHAYEGTVVIWQGGGRIGPLLDVLPSIGMDGLTVVDPPLSGDCDLHQLKACIGDRACIVASLPYDELARASTDRIGGLIRAVLQAGARGGGLILSPCAALQRRDLPEKVSENLVYYLETAHRLGRYPIQI